MEIPFSPPRIDDKIIAEVTDTLKSGWITTGPKTKLFEQKLGEYIGNSNVLTVSSATAGLELVLKWFGIKEGDEVIVPVYTYCATANVVEHCGAKVIFCDVKPNDFNIDTEQIKSLVTERTKVIMPVDFGGFPADYKEIYDIIENSEIKNLFKPENEIQTNLGRILLLSDSAHSLGASYRGLKIGSVADISVFSFHAVKNLTTAEGGAIACNMPVPFDNAEIYDFFRTYSLHGQSKDAFDKYNNSSWRYDVKYPGFKANMTDILAAIGLVEIQRYEKDTMVKYKQIFQKYNKRLQNCKWAQLPIYKTNIKESSYHLYALRIKDISESKRDLIIRKIRSKNVSVNVHFIPIPKFTYYKEQGYNIDDYPVAYDNYSREISLPAFYELSDEQIDYVLDTLIWAVEDSL